MLMDRYFNLQNHDNVLKDLANIVSSISDFVTEENSPITERWVLDKILSGNILEAVSRLMVQFMIN